MFKHRTHKIPALNTTSTADISFMLLIFFLVTTSMDRDQGMKRLLPPLDNDRQEVLTDVSRDRVMKIALDAQNRLSVNDSLSNVKMLRRQVADFVAQEQLRTTHILQVTCDPQTSYEAYFRVQNEIVAAYAQLRRQRALKVYHKSYARCSAAEREALQKYYPQRIAEDYGDDEKKGGESQ